MMMKTLNINTSQLSLNLPCIQERGDEIPWRLSSHVLLKCPECGAQSAEILQEIGKRSAYIIPTVYEMLDPTVLTSELFPIDVLIRKYGDIQIVSDLVMRLQQELNNAMQTDQAAQQP
jgi:hypothetical protein